MHLQLGASLLHNTVLTKLDLHYNDITPFGATALAHVLKVNTTLLSLDLSYNGQSLFRLRARRIFLSCHIFHVITDAAANV
jgi:hypothetical protein